MQSQQGRTSWFAVYSGYRAEFRAEEALREAGLDAWCPREKVFRRRQGRKHKVTLPLLPRYLFVGLQPTAHGPAGPEFPFDLVRLADGVDGIVGISGAPVEVPYGEFDPELTRLDRARSPSLCLAQLRQLEANGLFDRTGARREPMKGEAVEIVGGQFQSYPARFQAMKGTDRVRVLFQMFGRWSPLELKVEQVSWPEELAKAA